MDYLTTTCNNRSKNDTKINKFGIYYKFITSNFNYHEIILVAENRCIFMFTGDYQR